MFGLALLIPFSVLVWTSRFVFCFPFPYDAVGMAKWFLVGWCSSIGVSGSLWVRLADTDSRCLIRRPVGLPERLGPLEFNTIDSAQLHQAI